MAPDPIARTGTGKAVGRGGFNFLEHLGSFLGQPPPQTLLITGASGTGKSTLLRALIPKLKGPGIFVAYRAQPAAAGGVPVPPRTGVPLALLLVDPNAPGNPDSAPGAEHLMSFAPAALQTSESFPEPIARAIARLSSQGGGFVVSDSWDAESEREFRGRAQAGGTVQELETTTPIMRAQFGQFPVRCLIAISFEPDLEMLSRADGVIHLGWEDVEGFQLRVVSIPKLRTAPAPETRYLYTLDGAVFNCPPQLPQGFRPPIGPPPPDPSPQEESLWPGSEPFATAFGRLRYHGLTGLEVPPRFPSYLADVFLYPLVAHTLSIGGRVVWIPSAMSTPLQITTQLSRFIPPEFLAERLRVLSVGGADQGLGELKPVALSIRKAAPTSEDGRTVPPSPASPMFPEAYHFLRSVPERRPCLLVVYVDGLNAIAAVAGIPLNPAAVPMILGAYARLPMFHGFGFARSDDPLDKTLAMGIDTLIHVEEKYGRTVLLGLRPRTNPYFLDWTDEGGRYALIPMK